MRLALTAFTDRVGCFRHQKPVFAQTKWELPAASPPPNSHTKNLMQFAPEVDKAAARKLKVTVHSKTSLSEAPKINCAVQAQAGSDLQNLAGQRLKRTADFRHRLPAIFGQKLRGFAQAVQGSKACAGEKTG